MWKLRQGKFDVSVAAIKTSLENYPVPVSWQLQVVHLPVCLREPSGASLKKGQALHLVIFLLANREA